MIRLGVFLDGIEALAFFHVPITPCFVIGLKILIRLAQYCEQQFPSLQCVWMACSAGLFLSFSPVPVLNGTRLSIFGVAFLVRNGLEDAAVFGE